jgi:allophanate hydrolase subunit 1
MGALSLLAAGISGVSQTQQKSERAALPVQTQARAAFGISMLGGMGGMPVYGGASAPWFAPRYNQRKARRDARRVNRAVKR